MRRELTSWWSPSLRKEMPVATYGHYGFALLMVPTAGADYLEYERFGLIETLKPFIDGGKMKVYSVNSMNKESWMNYEMYPPHKAIRHNEFNNYIYDEVIPHIRRTSSQDTMIFICGASFGALHSMNLFLKRPDLLNGVIAMSGVYNLMEYSRGYYDEQVYYNSPVMYMPNLTDNWQLEQIRKSHHIHIYTGSGPYEDPNGSRELAGILYNKNIWYDLSVWGAEWKHDWPTWQAMLPYIIGNKF